MGLGKVGGTTDARAPNAEETTVLATDARAGIAEKAGVAVDSIEVLSVATQTVAGTNFFGKLKLQPSGKIVHARVHRGLPSDGSKIEVVAVRDATADEALEYF
jgi:hypothetical protein